MLTHGVFPEDRVRQDSPAVHTGWNAAVQAVMALVTSVSAYVVVTQIVTSSLSTGEDRYVVSG